MQQLRISEVLVRAWLSPVFRAAAAPHIVRAGLVRWKSVEEGGKETEKDHEKRERAEVTKR